MEWNLFRNQEVVSCNVMTIVLGCATVIQMLSCYIAEFQCIDCVLYHKYYYSISITIISYFVYYLNLYLFKYIYPCP